MINKKIHHNAYFWLNNPNDLNEKEIFLTSLKKFIGSSSYANQTVISQSMEGDCKGVIDKCSYNFCLTITFNTQEEHDSYKEEKAYDNFVDEVGHLWRKVQVFNSEEIWKTVLEAEGV